MPPAQSAKRASAESPSGDRLSALPDALLYAVLYFLPAPQAVQTSVLSRRWRHLWRTSPCVSIDMREFGITMAICGKFLKQRWRKFEDFTTSLLLFRSSDVSLDKFLLYTTPSVPKRMLVVDRWVRRGIMYCPQVIEVLIPGPQAVAFPFPHLGASSCRLKRLNLLGVCLDHRFGEQIRSQCPVLEELELRKCRHSFEEITSSSLKRLIIDTLVNETGNHFVIRTTSVVYLQMTVSSVWYSNGISVHVTDSLVKAFIHLRCKGGTFSLDKQRSLLVDLCNVPTLVLRGFQTKAMLVEESDKFPVFRNMKTMSLAECFLDKCHLYAKLEALGSFLQNAPCLKKLTLLCCMFRTDSTMKGQILRKSISLPHHHGRTFQCPMLKSIEVVYQADLDNQLTELLWGIGRILPNVSITLTYRLLD
ncbi:unnamed protein product [Urochloa decumbens]|uniref:F-box domain-containing protein n=1 Tax=Urochloa decumbens TaxID=240449 RepID=A0ABC9D635_9POAL